MSRPYQGISLHEGYNELDPIQVEVSSVESAVDANRFPENSTVIDSSRILLFKIVCTSEMLVPTSYRAVFGVKVLPAEVYSYTLYPNPEGYIQLDVPQFPITTLPDASEPKIIPMRVKGQWDSRVDESYLRVELEPGTETFLYTLIKDLVVYDGYLCVPNLATSSYYRVFPNMAVSNDTEAICISVRAGIAKYEAGEWTSPTLLTFYSIPNPDGLESFSDGFYQIGGGGTPVAYTLGSAGPFLEYTAYNNHPENFRVDVELEVFNGGTSIFSDEFNSLLPGNLDYTVVEMSCPAPGSDVDPPDLADIEGIAGVEFDGEFLTYMTSRGLTNLKNIQRAGPISYLTGVPAEPALAVLQSHVDLYLINPSAEQNQIVIDAEYTTVYAIATTAKDVFLNDVVGVSFPLYEAALMHEMAVQGQKFLSVVLAGTLSDYQLVNSPTPQLIDSDFAEEAFANNINACACSDCKSMVSPFAYLMDLVRYCSERMDYGTYNHSTPNYGTFITLLTNLFHQPFGSLEVSCETLHDEFCRVRLVTEVLEIVVGSATLRPHALPVLNTAKANYLMIVYKSLLKNAGTSIEELRNIVSIADATAKKEATQTWANRIGIPLYEPGTATLVSDRLWLTYGAGVSTQVLNGLNLEDLFGYRNTASSQTAPTLPAKIVAWKKEKLKEIWKAKDYLLTAFSREGATISSTPETNWKPIIDPDIIGITDMVYHIYEPAFLIWQNRKENTDAFLNYYHGDTAEYPDVLTRTSADILNRQVKISGRNLLIQQIDANEISLPDTASTWVNFTIYGKALSEASTVLSLSNPSPAMFQPYYGGSGPKMRYKRVLSVPLNEISTSLTTFTINWPTEVIEDVLSGGYARLESSGEPLVVYATTGGTETLSVSYPAGNQQATVTLGTLASPAFANGNVTFVYEVEVDLYTDESADPEIIADKLFTRTETYIPVSPPFASNLTYEVWDVPAIAPWDSGISDYANLKNINQGLKDGTATASYYEILSDYLHTTTEEFNRMMELLKICENYLASTFNAPKPSDEELFEMASLFRNCAKARNEVREYWIEEELRYAPSGGGSEILLQLNGQYFWRPLTEPQQGAWDPRLQTIPNSAANITDKHVPIIDPELVSRENLLHYPLSQDYLDLYDGRVLTLASELSVFYSWVGVNLFEDVLNYVANNDETVPYDVSPYASLADMLVAITSNDAFEQQIASSVAWDVFRLVKEDFISMMELKTNYESLNPSVQPKPEDLDKGLRMLVSAYKRRQLYDVVTTGWIQEEISGSYTTPSLPVKYYNVFPMKMATGRAKQTDRTEWQKTLQAWNRQALVNPDIVPPEYIKTFITSNAVHDEWVSRKTSEDTLFADIRDELDPVSPITNAVLLTRLEEQIVLLIAREPGITPISTAPYLHYFTDIAVKEKAGQDILPLIGQLGFSITEYRYLRKIYDFILSANPASTASLFAEEYDDVANIMLRIRKRNLSFTNIFFEFENEIYLTDEWFVLYSPSKVKFPQNTLPVVNPWRFSISEQKEWKDTLEGRIDTQKAVTDKWKDVIIEVEDECLPYLRDAYIEALQDVCETFDSAADRLAKSYFIETRDNCCVKHTRVSFAIETIQGLVFALQNGVYDEYISGFTLFAPYISREWKWIGSYASWRSAVFVFVYPENLLYPTLKRRQSPKFIEIANRLQGATRFSANDACDAGKEYTEYLNDIQDIEIVCSTNTLSKPLSEDPSSCCDDSAMTDVGTTYFFGKAPGSGYSYMSHKYTDDTDAGAHSFWERLSLPKDSNPIGCFVFKDFNDKGVVISNSLWLFYTYFDNGKLILAYSIKDVSKSNSGWRDEKVNDLPTFRETAADPYAPTYVMACQQSSDTRNPSFMIGYRSKNNGYYHCHLLFVRETKKVSPESFDVTGSWFYPNDITPQRAVINNWQSRPISAVNFRSNPSVLSGVYQTLAVAFESEVVFLAYGITARYAPSSILHVGHFIGLYELNGNSGNVLVLYLDYSDQKHKAYTVNVSYNLTSNNLVTIVTNPIAEANLTPELQRAYRIYPVFAGNTDFNRVFAVGSNANSGGAIGAKLQLGSGPLSLSGSELFMLSPDGGFRQEVSSSECIADLKLRKLMIEQHMLANANPPLGNVAASFQCTNSQFEYLIEAYYSLPLLLALDQQQRGQYESALQWYRTIYDYTEDQAANRKIYYGLIVEENIGNTYIHAADWLLDPLNPHLIAKTRANAHTKYVLINIVQCLFGFADRQYTLDTVETVPQARKLYTAGLDLLKTPELNKKTNVCADLSTACLVTGTELDSDPAWSNMVDKLQGLLNTYSNAATLQDIVDNHILPIFNNGALTLEEKFTQAFDYLYANPPGPGSSEPVSTVMLGLPDKMNDTYRYALAVDNPAAFFEGVSSSFKTAAASVSGLSRSAVSDPGSVSRLAWMNTAIPQNDATYSRSFSNVSGVQNLPNLPVNPLAVDRNTFASNVAYSNAPVFVDYQSNNNLPSSFIPMLYYPFCLPANPVFDGLVLRGNLELYKIFNCRNIAGMVRDLDPYAAATDSTTGVPVIGAGGTLNVPGNKVYNPSQYRFRVLIERAKQLVSQSQQLESLFLAAMEKLDAENYNYLQAKQGLETAKATVRLQDLRISQANNEKQVVVLQRNKSLEMVTQFQQFITNGQNQYELASIEFLNNSIDFLEQARIAQIVAGVLQVGQGIASAFIPGGGAAAAVFGAAAGVANTVAGIKSTKSSIESINSSIQAQMASHARREEEWTFQSKLAELDAGIGNQQIQVADDNIRIVSQEKEIASLNVSHAEESLNFLQNKFTNAALYGWMSGVLERAYSYMLNTSTAVASIAERQLYFERQEQAGPFILNDYWEAPSSGGPGGSSDRRGLTGSARLLTDITKLEQYAFDSYKRKLQMKKGISLANNFPDEFQRFRETGILNFQLTNKQFDYDFPGHYLRLINNVKTTVVGLVPVYDGIKASLTAGTISYTVIGGNTFQKIPIKRLELESVALTSTVAATGVFEMQPNQAEVLNPFEGMGVESQWEFKMPPFTNRFDLNNIADILLEVNYTALDSYLYKYQVLQELDNKLSFNRPFSFKNDFPDQWYELGEAEAGSESFGVTFEFRREMFPQGVLDLKLNKAENLVLYFARKEGYVQELEVYDFSLYTPQAGEPYAGGPTLNGRFDTSALMSTLGTSPVIKLRLLFENTVENRTMFSDGSIQDIIMIVPCQAELKAYPM